MGFSLDEYISGKRQGEAGSTQSQLGKVQPYIMGRDTASTSTPYAAGLQAKQQAPQMPKSVKTETSQPSFAQRAVNTVTGGLKGTAASMTNMVGTLRELGQAGRDKQNQALIDDYARQLEEAQMWLDAALEDAAKNPDEWTEGDIQGRYNARDLAQLQYDAVAKVYGKENQENTILGVYEAADKLQQSSAQDIAQAKEGLGVAGQMVVDAGTVLTQTAGDAVGGAVTGNGMIPFAMRAFGSGAQKARQDGADLKGQLAYGAVSAAKEVITEKMFSIAMPLSRIYGGGSMDDVVKQTIQKAVDKLASTEQGKKVLGGFLTWAASGATEGLEDLIGDWMEWQLPRIYGGDVDSAIDTLKNSLYDFGVSAIAGLAGGTLPVGQYIMGVDEDTDAQLRQVAEEMAGEALDTGAAQAQKTASTKKPKMRMEDFTDVNSPVWNNVAYEDIETQKQIMGDTHKKMVESGEVVTIPQETIDQMGEYYPDLRAKKKVERIPILKQKVSELKAILHNMLNELKGSHEFEVNGNILEVKLYDTGVGEVLEKITQSKAAVIAHSAEIFQGAQYMYSTPDYDGDPNIYRWNYFYTPVQLGEETVGVRIAVKDLKNPQESQLYHWGIKKDTAVDGGGRGENPRSPTDVSLAMSDTTIIPSPGDGVNIDYAPQSGEDILAQAAREMTETEATQSRPTTYEEFVTATGQPVIMTERDFAKRKAQDSAGVSGYADYQDYLDAMFQKYKK